VLLAAEVLAVVGLAQPASLARLLARRPAPWLGTVFLAVTQPRIAAKQFLAAQASSSSGLRHGGFQITLGTASCPNRAVRRHRTGLRGDSHRRFHVHRCQHGIGITIPANAQNRSR
jgi:hypothetical protein